MSLYDRDFNVKRIKTIKEITMNFLIDLNWRMVSSFTPSNNQSLIKDSLRSDKVKDHIYDSLF